MFLSILFYIIAFVAVGSAIFVVLNRNAVYSAVALVLCFFCLAILYLLLEAYFLAVLEIFIYAGAIMVLFLFAIMLLNLGKEKALPKVMHLQRGLSALLIIVFCFGIYLFYVQGSGDQHQPMEAFSGGGVYVLGEALFSKFLLPFEIAS